MAGPTVIGTSATLFLADGMFGSHDRGFASCHRKGCVGRLLPRPICLIFIIPAVSFGVPAYAERIIGPPSFTQSAKADPSARGMRLVQNAAYEIEDISGAPGQSIAMKFKMPPGEQSAAGFVMFRGVPETLSLIPGFRTKNTWIVSLKALADLKLVVPDDYQGSFDIEAIFVHGYDDRRDTRTATVRIGETTEEAETPAPPDRVPTNATAAPEVTATAPPTVSEEEERATLERAFSFLKNGDVAAARLLYEHLATNGSALGALSLAKTYDPDILLSLGVVGMRPDMDEARRWYQRAAELGSEFATNRLKALAAR